MTAEQDFQRFIFETVTREIGETTVTERRGRVTVARVNPDKVGEMIRMLRVHGVNQILYRGQVRRLNPQLSEDFAKTALVILRYTLKELITQHVPILEARNWGSAITGLIGPESDVDIALDFDTKNNLEKAYQLIQNASFGRKLWRVRMPVTIPSISYTCSVPSEYSNQPGEKWLPSAHGSIILKHP